MKAINVKLFYLLILTFIIGQSCDTRFGKGKYSKEDLKKIDFILKQKVSYEELQAKFESDELCITCPESNYCGITKETLKGLIKNYRDEDWVHSSNYFNDYFIQNPNSSVAAAMQNMNPDAYNDDNNFDSRFMDISISELENYLCSVKKSKFKTEPNIIRFYFIKYGDQAFKPEYKFKHSLAMVPVNADNGQTTEEYTDFDKATNNSNIFVFGMSNCEVSPMANHNRLCPPFSGCFQNTMIQEVDAQ